MYDLTIIGGGAAGIFGAIAAKEGNPSIKVSILEKSGVLLAKVRVSGGGRCNVTHACFEPDQLIHNYPRGHKELLGPFHRFNPRETIEWFERHGVALKAEADGRIFPTTDSSETIIDALLFAAQKLNVEIQLRQKILDIEKKGDFFEIVRGNGPPLQTRHLLLATGSSAEGHRWASHLGHTLQKPVPSLFTFNVPQSPLSHLSGIAMTPVEVKLPQFKLIQRGPLLITHFGFSGPAVLKLSAWGARLLHEVNYQTDVEINWLPDLTAEAIFAKLKENKGNVFHFPKNLWKYFLESDSLRSLANRLHGDRYKIEGKTVHKEEFVTCGGLTLSEINFKTLQSKICPGLFFAGEILDIDGVTGGFNFQSAWTTSFIAGRSSADIIGTPAT